MGPLDGAPLGLRYRANAVLAGPAYAGRQLLLLDRAGTGRVVEAFGDLSRAHRIAVLVPGVDNRLADFDRGLGGVQRRAPAWQARQLRASVGSDVAVVAWLGYLPPAGIDLDAVRSERAQRGADELVAFVRGLAVQAPQATAVVVGHSYGSLVAGYAARRLPADVTDLVEIGSPGLDVEHCRDLQARARVWAGSSPSDWDPLAARRPDLRAGPRSQAERIGVRGSGAGRGRRGRARRVLRARDGGARQHRPRRDRRLACREYVGRGA